MAKPTSNRSLLRGFEILHAFDKVSVPTLTSIAAHTGLPKSTTSRFLAVLVEEGYLRVGEKQVYQLTPKVLELGFSALRSLGISEVVSAPLQHIADTCQGAANIAELDGTDVIMVARRSASLRRERFFSMNIRVGTRLPALFTATGRVLLASRPDVLELALQRRHEDRPHPGCSVDEDELRAQIDQIAKTNASVIEDVLAPGFGAAAIACKIDNTREIALSGSYLIADHAPEFPARLIDELRLTQPRLMNLLSNELLSSYRNA